MPYSLNNDIVEIVPDAVFRCRQSEPGNDNYLKNNQYMQDIIQEVL